ncbi:GatB/YqeY domain-containing protein [Clostridium cylindrosporum]|uniref:GatB/YqeY domain-containing protein n=1 Tax=Clostridium cylindrosporum DSM 605 TaxID=1121307 RepID=A0A0J8DBF9_CLOCY|nr:GatB/YqeY domain-containing protein [Clostridium cylindrosporum]KMT21649.1 GatB/YqeY domain-containing protein [Clostridium cylindrosporum DSM 605]
MSLKDELQNDWKAALKARESFKASVLNMAKAAILNEEKNNKGSSLDDEQIITVLSKEVKMRRDAIIEFEKGNRQDLVNSTNQEIEILLGYLPQQLTENEITEIVTNAVKDVDAKDMKDMGKVMSIVNPKTKGRADGKLVSQIVKNCLSK